MKANRVQFHEVSMVGASAGLAFALELAALGAVTRWGWRTGGWLGAGGTLVAFAAGWSTLLSPRAPLPVTGPAWPLAKLAVFAVSAAALLALTGPLTTALFLALALLSVILGGIR